MPGSYEKGMSFFLRHHSCIFKFHILMFCSWRQVLKRIILNSYLASDAAFCRLLKHNNTIRVGNKYILNVPVSLYHWDDKVLCSIFRHCMKGKWQQVAVRFYWNIFFWWVWRFFSTRTMLYVLGGGGDRRGLCYDYWWRVRSFLKIW